MFKIIKEIYIIPAGKYTDAGIGIKFEIGGCSLGYSIQDIYNDWLELKLRGKHTDTFQILFDRIEYVLNKNGHLLLFNDENQKAIIDFLIKNKINI